ncbi:MAG TPA: hypothetical protein VLL08_32315, partial [Kineosporiaceae bacterium]|nr:hypothetical protein [Kineosporiaceae bacterium]
EQHGLAARTQLTTAGISRGALQWRLGRSWRAVLPGVVATFTGVLDPVQRLIAAQLYAGPEAIISSWTAAGWHGVEAARRSPIIRLTLPDRLHARSTDTVIVTRTKRPDAAPWLRGPLRISSRARAVVDAARDLPNDREAGAIVLEAVQRGIVTTRALRHELECGSRKGSAKVRRAVDAAEAGAWSVPEVDLLALLRTSHLLPEVWANPLLTSVDGVRLPTPDVWVDEVGLAVQVHSRTYHLRDQQWDATVAGDSLLGECGVVVLGVTPRMITNEPMSIRTRVERAYQALRDRPRPHILAQPRITA